MAAIRTLRSRWRSDSGAEFVEFALGFPLLLLVVMGIIDFGILFQQYQVVVAAAREGARVGVLPTYTSADAVNRARAYINTSIMSQGAVDLNSGPYAPTASVGNVSLGGGKCMSTITVNTAYPHEYLFLSGIASYFGASFGTKDLHGTATMRMESVVGTCP